jgi:hypothetical protein
MALLYFHNSTCISPQQTFPVADFSVIKLPELFGLEITEPDYDGIPAGILRRMGKAIRIGVGAALPLVKNNAVDGIIIGTANGGMEDCIKFLNQIIDYNEGRLTPGNFVASTANAIASQLGLMLQNKGYNNTHVQSGLSFENALLDAALLLKEDAQKQYLVGGIDEISAYNYNIDKLYGWFKKNPVTSFYEDSEGTIAGEGAAMFIVNGNKENSTASLEAMDCFHTTDEGELAERIGGFIIKHTAQNPVDLFITGENGDSRFKRFYTSWKHFTGRKTVARYKHLCGEYATSSAFALWLSIQILNNKQLPPLVLSGDVNQSHFKNVLIVNHYKENQHSIMLVRRDIQ